MARPAPAPAGSARAASPGDVATSSGRGDAESLLRARLRGGEPFALFFQALRDDQLSCEQQLFANVREGGTKFDLEGDRPPPSVLSGGSISSLVMPALTRGVHGYSPRSLLVEGSEGFFSREDCMAHGLRYPPRHVAAPTIAYSIGELIDAHGRASVWYRGRDPASFVGRRDAWLELAGATYQARFYEDTNVAWLWGPIGGSSVPRAGLYRARSSPTAFSVGADLFCRSPADCPASLVGSEPALFAAEPRSDVVDFAEQFWNYPSPLFAPLRDGGDVACVELRPRHAETLRLDLQGKRREHPILRSVAGFRFGRRKPGGWVWGEMVAHSRDAQAFWLNGSPWFFRVEDCLAQRQWVKPVNFRATGVVTLTDAFGEQRVPLVTRYFVIDSGGEKPACRRLQLRPLQAGGRLELERAGGVEARDYDFYLDEWAFWIGPVLTGTLPDSERYRGKLVVPRATASGVELDGWRRYATQAACTAELVRLAAAPPPATSSSAAPASAPR
jgi:hypothetical protein